MFDSAVPCLGLIRSCFWMDDEFLVYVFLLFLPFLLFIHIRVVLFSLMSFVFINFPLISYLLLCPLASLSVYSSVGPLLHHALLSLSHLNYSFFYHPVLFSLPSSCFTTGLTSTGLFYSMQADWHNMGLHFCCDQNIFSFSSFNN